MTYWPAHVEQLVGPRSPKATYDLSEIYPDEELAAEDELDLMDEIESHPTWNTSPEHS